MSDLKKATLFELNPDGSLKDPNGTEVQFNPATMRLQISNATEGGESRGRQVRQHLGKSSTTLTLDLIFDTADEGTTSAPDRFGTELPSSKNTSCRRQPVKPKRLLRSFGSSGALSS